MATKCTKHEYRYVNNRYDKNGKMVIQGGEWKTERMCAKCDDVFEVPSYLKAQLVESLSP
jgi:hypothetical protein